MNNQKYIGEILEVKIDRELGSKHPKHGFIYSLNYGYIPNTISGDGEELDCYVLGVFEPVQDFKGNNILIFTSEWNINWALERNEGLILEDFSKD